MQYFKISKIYNIITIDLNFSESNWYTSGCPSIALLFPMSFYRSFYLWSRIWPYVTKATLCRLTLWHFTLDRLTQCGLTQDCFTLCRLTLDHLTLGRFTPGSINPISVNQLSSHLTESEFSMNLYFWCISSKALILDSALSSPLNTTCTECPN